MAKPKPGAVGPASRSARTSPTAWRTSRARSTTRSSRSPTRRATSSPGRRPATSASRARASRTPFAAQMAAEKAARAGHGARRAQGRRAGEGSGLGPRDRHPLASRTPASRSPASRTSPRCRTTAAARRSGGGSDMARYTGPVCRLCRRERHEALPRGHQGRHHEVPDRAAALPAGRARPHPPREHGSEYLMQLQEKQKARFIYGLLEKQFRNLYEEANRQQGVTGENLLRFLELRLDNVVFRAGWARHPRPGPPVRQPRPRRGQRPAGQHPELPGPQGRRRHAARQGPRDDRRPPQPRHARPPHPAAGSRPATAATQVTVRDLPLREHIDVPVREQLIVELYSK